MANDEINDYECNIFATKTEDIVRELVRVSRNVSRRHYGTTHLIFSDGYVVSLTDSGVVADVEEHLRAGRKPLGFIAPDRERKRNPIVETWETRDKAADAELRHLARWMFWHLLPERNEQPGNDLERGK